MSTISYHQVFVNVQGSLNTINSHFIFKTE